MAVDAILFRFTNAGDTLAGLNSLNKIEFNLEATDPDDTGRVVGRGVGGMGVAVG